MGMDNLREFLTRDMVYFKDFLNLTDEQKKSGLPHEFHYFIEDYLHSSGIDLDGEEYADLQNEMESYELVERLEQHYPEIFNGFATWLLDKIEDHTLNIMASEYPSWAFLDSGEIIKRQWLIHFTDYADDIAENGFTRGVYDYTKLGLTTSMGEFEKEHGGYNFAYTLDDFYRYGYDGWSKYKYGSEAVIFQASGIKAWHYSDQEPQVIFFGNTASNIIPLTSGYEADWSIRNQKSGEIIYETDDLRDVVDWVSKNYLQYRRVLHESIRQQIRMHLWSHNK